MSFSAIKLTEGAKWSRVNVRIRHWASWIQVEKPLNCCWSSVVVPMFADGAKVSKNPFQTSTLIQWNFIIEIPLKFSSFFIHHSNIISIYITGTKPMRLTVQLQFNSLKHFLINLENQLAVARVCRKKRVCLMLFSTFDRPVAHKWRSWRMQVKIWL